MEPMHPKVDSNNNPKTNNDQNEEQIDLIIPNLSFKSQGDTVFPNIDNKKFAFKEFLICSGSALLMCIAYLDPGNLQSNLQAANLAGYKLLWILLWSHVLGFLIQNLSSRLGMKSTKGMAGLIKEKYGKKTSFFIWISIELAIIGCDVQEVIGTSSAFLILFGLPIKYGVPLTFLTTAFFLVMVHYGMRWVEGSFALLLSIMALCFFVEVVISKPDALGVFLGILIPRIPKDAMYHSAAMVGAIIMPHNIYLHSGLVSNKLKEKKISNIPNKRLTKYFSLESIVSLTMSLFTNICIYATFAKVFHDSNITSKDVGFEDASESLKAFKKAAVYFWGIGLLAAGQTSTITGTVTGQMVMEGFFELKVPRWVRALVTRSLALVPSTLIAIFANEYFDELSQFINVFQSLQLPLTLMPLILLTGDQKVMNNLKNSKLLQIFYSLIVLFIVAINVYVVLDSTKKLSWAVRAPVLAVGVIYLGFVVVIYRNYK